MQVKQAAKGLISALMFTAAATMAQASTAAMDTTGRTNPPIGHYQFCQQYRDQCQDQGRDPGPLELTEARWKAILKVNYKVNSSIEPETDEQIYGIEEKWAYPTNVGDCEDYVLLKRKLLEDMGFSPANC